MVVGSMAGGTEDTADNGQRFTVRVRLGMVARYEVPGYLIVHGSRREN
jgi:hypothetical protein